MERGMETKIEDLKSKPEREMGAVPPEVIDAADQEIKELGPDDSSKSSARWKKVLIAGTIFAGVMALTMTSKPKPAEAGPHLSQVFEQAVNTAAQRTAEGLGKGIGNTVERLFGGGKTAEEQRDEQKLNDDMLRQGFNLKVEGTRRGWQKQDNKDNTQTQLDAEYTRQYHQELKEAGTDKQRIKDVKEKYGMQ